ncbi:MAG: hypothetical protein QXU18_03920 [Thermoplasmatales archaeon]
MVAIPSSIDMLRKLDFLAIEMHSGHHLRLIPFMETKGFKFMRVTRKAVILNALRFGIRHPLQATTVYSLLKQAGEYPGIGKIIKGIEISSSDDLVLGLFSKQKEMRNEKDES